MDYVLGEVVFACVSQSLGAQTANLRSAGWRCAKAILILITCCLLSQSATAAAVTVKEARRVLIYGLGLNSAAAVLVRQQIGTSLPGAVGGAVRIRKREKPQDIPVASDAKLYLSDWRALRRWGFSEMYLPGSVVLHRQPTVKDSYKKYIIGAILLFFTQTLLIFALLWQRTKKNGAAERMLGMAVDVTHRKQAEEVQRRHDAIVEFSDDAIISEDLDGVIRSWNRGAQRLFGFSKEEAIGKPIGIVIPDELQAEENDILARLTAGQPVEHYETVHITKQKEKIDVSLTVSPICNSAGRVVGASRIARDITERRRAEDSLRESEERFRLVANAAPVMIWMSGRDKLCTYFNEPWLKFTGRSIEAELGNGWADSVHPDDLQACWESYAQAFDRQEPFNIEYRLRRHDGEYRWVFDTGVARFSPYGSFAGYIGSCIDVSDRKLAEEALSSVSRRLIEAHEEERTRIARELHDDINQRIALLAVNLERLKQDLLAGVQTGGRIDEVHEQLANLGSDVQSLSHRLHSSKLDNLGLAAAAAGFCREFSDRQKVQIDFHAVDVPKRLPQEISLCLFRVLQEGLQNAVKHSRSRQFQVWLGGASHEISLSVSDSGVGFNPEAAFQGQGIGLTSMKERLKLVGGEFSVDSQLDCGTTIHARVPLGLA